MTKLDEYLTARAGAERARQTIAKYSAAGARPRVRASASRLSSEVIVEVQVRYQGLDFTEAESLASIITTLFSEDGKSILQQGMEMVDREVEAKRLAAVEEARRELNCAIAA